MTARRVFRCRTAQLRWFNQFGKASRSNAWLNNSVGGIEWLSRLSVISKSHINRSRRCSARYPTVADVTFVLWQCSSLTGEWRLLSCCCWVCWRCMQWQRWGLAVVVMLETRWSRNWKTGNLEDLHEVQWYNSAALWRWLLLRVHFYSTAVRRAFDCLSKVIQVTVT